MVELRVNLRVNLMVELRVKLMVELRVNLRVELRVKQCFSLVKLLLANKRSFNTGSCHF
jgi:hypothetical protein